jgi:FAD synthetase
MNEDARERTSKYLKATDQSLKSLKVKDRTEPILQSQLDHVLELVRGYVSDARHYAEEGKPVTSLACVAYAEGLLDALKFLELAEF